MMDDATASDNCGEVTISVWNCWQLPIVRLRDGHRHGQLWRRLNVTLTMEEVATARNRGEPTFVHDVQLIYTATDDAGNSNTAVVEMEVGDTVPEGTATATATSSMPSAFVVEIVWSIQTETASVTCSKSLAVRTKRRATTTQKPPKTTVLVPTPTQATTVTASVWKTSTRTASATFLKCPDVPILPTPATTPTRRWTMEAVWWGGFGPIRMQLHA